MVEMVKTILNGQYEIILPKHRADRPEWYTFDGWEKKRINSMHENLNKDDILYYVGVEEGDITALCQIWGVKIVMFEPNPKVWPNIKAIWEANKLENPLKIYLAFASNEDKTAINPQNDRTISPSGWPVVADFPVIGNHGFKELYQEADSYDQVKIDTIVEQTGIIPTAITLDVEGSEWQVLRGAEKTLREYHPKIWLSGHPEFIHDQWGEDLRDLRNWLKDMGYKEELLDYQHEVHLYYHL